MNNKKLASELLKLAKTLITANSKEQQIILDICKDIEDCSVYNDYSGRGMFGEKCIGIDCRDKTEVIEEAASRGLRGAKYDNLGLGWIVYWPKVKPIENYKG